MRRLLPLTLICSLLTAGLAHSTTVVPPTFAQLVGKAQTIFVGQVIGQQAEWRPSPTGRRIVTHVTFRVEDVWKGSVGAVTQLEFLGGTIGDTTMEVVGMPIFRMGQRDVLFVGDTVRTVSPLVGFMHGRLRVEREPRTGVDSVRTHDGRSLGATMQIGAQRGDPMISIAPMRLSALAAEVRERISAEKGR